MLKHEIKRVFYSKEWKLALLTGVLITLFQYYIEVIPAVKWLSLGSTKGMIPHSVFSKWIGADGSSVASRLYFILLPILAVLPHGGSYYRDLKSGYIRQMILLKGRRSYVYSKYITAFVSGGLVVVLPLVLNLVMTAAVLPSIKPVIAVGYFPWSYPKRFMPMLPYTHPYLYTVIYLFIIFMFAGAMNGMSLAVSSIARNTFTVWIAPFVLLVFTGSIASIMGYGYYNVTEFLNPVQMIPGISWGTLAVSFLVMTVPSVIGYIAGRWKADVY